MPDATDTTTPQPLNLTMAEYVSYLGMGLTALGLGSLAGKTIGEFASQMGKMRENARQNPWVDAHRVAAHRQPGYHVAGHLRDGSRVAPYNVAGHHVGSYKQPGYSRR